MKRIINSMVYNTQTATEVAEHVENHPRDFRYVRETLYRTDKGAYFVHGEGGPSTRYAMHKGNTAFGGEQIELVEDAFEWLTERNQYDIAIQLFPERVAIG